MIPNFPPRYKDLCALYSGFEPRFEHHRNSFRDFMARYLKQVSLRDLEKELATNDATAQTIKVDLRQRHFYKSATCFYRCFDLFLAYITLQNKLFGTWSEVTGYYSRFYFVQALVNLLQGNWFANEERMPVAGLINKKEANFYVYNTGQAIAFLNERELYDALQLGPRRGSHQIWWSIYKSLGLLDDYPQFETLEFVLGDGYFNPARRNEVNYSHEYIRAFPELEWFDSATESMMAQFSCQCRREDRDITNMDRFFADFDPEDCDVGDFYGDEAQMLWCSIDCYLRFLSALRLKQDFITPEKIEALATAHFEGRFPNLLKGIVTSVEEALSS